MDNYIKKPTYINDVYSLHSNNFRDIDFLKYFDSSNNTYRLDLLRYIYMSDKALFFNVRDEMLLRGFKIKTEKESSLFPHTDYHNNNQFIHIEFNNDNYSKIDFVSLKLGNLINRFNIDDDRFFNLIPLNNFKYLNQNINLNLLYQEFSNNGFSIVEEDEIRINKNNPENIEEISPDLNKYASVTIEEYFSGGSYNLFIKFCYENNVNYVEEINNELLDKFKDYRQVGLKRYETTREKYKSFRKNETPKIEVQEGPVFNISSLLTKKYTIESYFSENNFNQFKYFCKKSKITYLEDLTHSHLNMFEKLKGIGPKKLNGVISKIEIIKEKVEQEHNFIFNYNLNYFDLHEFSVNELLNFIRIDQRLQEDLMIEDIYGEDIRMLSLNEEDENILYNLLTKLDVIDNPNNILQNFINNLDERDRFILIERYKNNMTLEKIGEKIGVTRERVRQVSKNIAKDIVSYLKQNLFKESILLSFISFDNTEYKILTVSDFNYFIEQEYLFFLKILIESNSLFFYEDKYNLFFLEKSDKDYFRIEMEAVIEQLPDIFVLEETHEAFQANFFKKGNLSIELFLKKNSYKRFGKIYSQKTLVLEDILQFLFEREMPAQVKMNEENYEKVIKISKEKYNYNLENPLSSVMNTLHNSDKFLLVDGSTYKLLNIDDYNLRVLDDCINYCALSFKKRNHINAAEIFNEFKDVLLQEDIQNKTHLYSILKHLYNDKFKFGKGNTLNIYNNETKKFNEEDVLISFMEDNLGIRSRREIKSRFKWSDQKISLKTSVSDKIISWGRNNFRVIGDWIKEEYIEETEKIVDSFFKEQGFVTENQLFDEAQFSTILYNFIHQEKINSADKYRSIFRPFISALRGTTVFITPTDSNYNSIYDVLVEKFTLGVTRDGIYEYLQLELLYHDSTANMIMDKIISENIMFEMELGFLYPAEELDISNSVIKTLLNYIETEQKGSPYIILRKLAGYRAKLPKINVEWTPYLIKFILLNNGYKNVEVFNRDYRTDQLILIEESHEINNLDELLYIVLKNNYHGNWHEEYIAAYLEREGFLYKKRYRRTKLPISLYKNSKLINVDALGRVKLVGD